MTLAAPRSRQGRLALALAVFAALVAVSAALLWSTLASAQLPNTITELDQTPDGPGTVVPGGAVQYVASADITTDLLGTDELTIEVDFDADLINVSVLCSPVASASGVTATSAFCNWDDPVTAAAGPYSATVDGTASDDLVAPTATVCADADGNSACNETGTDVEAIDDDNPTDTGALTVDATGLVTIDPETATNPPGTSHVVTYSVAAGVNCQSANDPLDDDNLPRTCVTTDVTLSCANSTVDSVVVADADIANPSDIVVTISNDGTEESCTITLALVANDGNDDDADDVLFTVAATKDYSLGAVAGELRHWDIADRWSENAAGNIDGILDPQDDVDDATGSFHAACIMDSALTHAADAGDITWDIVPISAPNPSAVLEIPGPNGEPCVRWGSNGVGTHQVTATWDNGVAPAVTYFWDAYCVEGDTCYDADDGSTDDVDALELIKEWNDIEFTKIVAVDGNVGNDLTLNTGELANWAQRDTTYHQRANLDGTTVSVEGALIIGPNGFGNIDADGVSFLDYTIGGHSLPGEFYEGPLDGAEQTYTVTSDSCGYVRLENPDEDSGNVILLGPGDSDTVLSSDKGVGFQIVPNDDGAIETTPFNASCGLGGSVTVNIETEEQEDFGSPPLDSADLETITVDFVTGPPTNKQPVLLWSGMRHAVQHDWSAADGSCPWTETLNGPFSGSFFVRYTHQHGNGAFVSDLGDGIALGPDFMVVQVDGNGGEPEGEEQEYDANTDCISTVIWESQDPDEIDLVAHVVEPICPFNNFGSTQGFGEPFAGCDWSVISQQVPFLFYYMKFEDVTLGIVPGARADHNDGDFTADPGPVYDPAADVDAIESNVSADELARVRVRGWLEKTNCPVRESGVDSNGSFLPENRCIFPDDWEHLAGGVLAEEFRPNYDIMNAPDSGFNCSGALFLSCNTSSAPGIPTGLITGHNPAAGPFSVLDGPFLADSSAPYVGGGFREVWLHDGDVDEWDAPMPPALIRFLLEGSGFLSPADKKDVYHTGNNPFYATHIPAEPFISPINEDLSGYQWNTWGAGAKSGPYIFWTSLADNGAEVISCPGASPCPGEGVATGGYKMTKVYTDNHGEAMTWVNGDADLTFDDCDQNTPVPAFNIVQLSGYYCEQGDIVGNSTLGAVADYPDKRKHQPLASNEVTFTWTWGGHKFVSIEPGQTPQFNYVVLHLTDRDGFCDLTTSLHPVLGELVEFTIDSPEGIIVPDVNGNEAAGPPVSVAANKKFASTHTFVATANTSIANGGISVVSGDFTEGECQAWIHVSESQLLPVNVIIRAFDPEGTVTFDVLINEPPEPTPTPEPPTPTPAPPPHLWGDLDCDGDVDSIDALGGLRFVAGFFVDQTGPCFDIGSTVDVDGNDEVFGDWDCDGDVDAVDALQVLLFVAGLDGDQTPPCPNVGAGVTITA